MNTDWVDVAHDPQAAADWIIARLRKLEFWAVLGSSTIRNYGHLEPQEALEEMIQDAVADRTAELEKQLAERDGAITCYNEVLAELREEVATLRHQSINWVPIFDENMELQTQLAALRGEVEKYKCLDGFKQLQEEARKQTAQEIIQYIIDQGVIQDRFDGELVYYIIDSDINELRQRYGLEG